jgi:hypothetical protein
MTWFVTIEVESEDKAKFLVEDTKKTDSMCVTDEQGDEHEFEVLSISCEQRV